MLNSKLGRYFKVQLAYDDLKQILPQRAVVMLNEEYAFHLLRAHLSAWSSSANPEDAQRHARAEDRFKQSEILAAYEASLKA